MQDGATPWSDSFGFDMTAPAPASPLASVPGLLRWTPVDGASAYQVWLIDTGKIPWTRSNVLDEREFYTFHQSSSWIGTIRWRVRAVRNDYFGHRINGIPASVYGPWSPVYSSTNPAFPGTPKPIALQSTISDTVSTGSATSSAHTMMPGFSWTGNETLGGVAAEFYRVEIFTDKQCLNPVYYSAVVGSPAWAPRLSGPLSLPQDDAGVTAARAGYLGDGTESTSRTYDGATITPNEQIAAATPSTTVPGDAPAAPNTSPADDNKAGGDSSGSSSGSSSNPSGTGQQNTTTAVIGPPIDLWDVGWPQGGYYWTVIPVDAVGLGNSGTNVAAPGAVKGTKTIPVDDTTGFHVGDSITVGLVPSADSLTVTAVGSNSLTVSTATTFAHPPGDPVVRAGGSITYADMELAQDVCAAGRVQRFGISSDPTLTEAQAAFATGLSATGRLTSAAKTKVFYGSPLVAWTPAIGAGAYEVQYSKTAYPFKAEVDPRSSTTGVLTFSTADVLPLGPGTWYYRVRGIDFNLPTGVQQMGWSDPEKLVVAKPSFKIAPAPRRKFKILP
jgi:hypothetical protein